MNFLKWKTEKNIYSQVFYLGGVDTKSGGKDFFLFKLGKSFTFLLFFWHFIRIELKVFCSVDLLTLRHMYTFFSSKLSTCVSKLTGCVLLFFRLSKP